MNEDITDDTIGDDGAADEGEESFAELLEAYGAGRDEALQVGDKVSATVISVGGDTVFVDTGTKIDGVVDKQELCGDAGSAPPQVGDILELYVVEMTESEIRLSRAVSGAGGLQMLREAFENRIPVEGRVAETVKGGFRIEMLQRRAFCPVSQIDLTYVQTPEEYVGQTHTFLVTQLTENGRNIVVSRRRLLEQEQEKSRAAFLSTVRSGDIFDGTVTRVMPYGAFVALAPGVEGMVHVSELSWSRVANAADAVAPGDTVRARIIAMETPKDGDRVKLSLSLKQVEEDPWNRAAETFSVGDKVKGRVTRCMDFGVFVEIAPGIEGLVHISEMSYTRRVTRPDAEVRPGQTVGVMIKEISPGQRRISLSMRDAEGDPWMEVPEKYAVGQRITGTVQKRESFGIFVSLEPGVTGLLHQSRISRAANPSAIEKLKPGDTLPVVVERIDAAQRRIALHAGDAGEEDDWKRYAGDGRSALGSLGEKLQHAMEKKPNDGKRSRPPERRR